MLVIATPDTIHVRQMVDTARLLNPDIVVVLRSHNDKEARLLTQENIGSVFIGEQELANGMARHILRHMGLEPTASITDTALQH